MADANPICGRRRVCTLERLLRRPHGSRARRAARARELRATGAARRHRDTRRRPNHGARGLPASAQARPARTHSAPGRSEREDDAPEREDAWTEVTSSQTEPLDHVRGTHPGDRDATGERVSSIRSSWPATRLAATATNLGLGIAITAPSVAG